MFTVAIVGPDGAGKTTVCRYLEQALPWPTKYVYMGVATASANFTLPTTQFLLKMKKMIRDPRPTKLGGRPLEHRYKSRPKGMIRGSVAAVKETFALMNQLAEEWFRQCVVWYYLVRGRIVLLDRHFAADYVFDIVNRRNGIPLRFRVHAFVLERLYPKPDLVVYLDAPAEILLARKQEGTRDSLERMRQEYLQFSNMVCHFAIVDASQPQQDVVSQVATLVGKFYKARNNQQTKVLVSHGSTSDFS